MTGDEEQTLDGLLALSTAAEARTRPDPRSAATTAGAQAPALWVSGSLSVATWGGLKQQEIGADPLVLTLVSRDGSGDVRSPDLRPEQGSDATLPRMMPPFAAIQVVGDTLLAVTDVIGFRQLYYRSGDGWAAVSTSARALAGLAPTRLDAEGVGFQSLLGWQIGDRTMFEGVRKMRDGERAVLRHGRVRIERYVSTDTQVSRLTNAEAIPEAADLLRRYLDEYLDEHADAVLQLTGGIDSRILLAAVEPRRRRGLRVLTLMAAPGSEDVRIAGDLAARDGMKHIVRGFEDLSSLDPRQAYELAHWAAATLDGMADPIANAALSLAERQAPQGHRISGLGGEVARGFYYLGPIARWPVTRPATRLLTTWRMFANEAVPEGLLVPDFARERHRFALDDVYRTLLETRRPWLDATDHFYLYERMQRWAGITDTAVCLQRSAVNPMLDKRFLDIAAALPAGDKAGSRFLAGLLCHLDPGLGEIPMDGRKAPRAYADPSGLDRLTRQSGTMVRGYRKLRQRLRRESRPPAGAEVLSRSVVEYWRAHPDALAPARDSGFVREGWLREVLVGDRDPDTSSVAFLTSLSSARSVVG